MRTRIRPLTATVLAVVLLLSACAGEDAAPRIDDAAAPPTTGETTDATTDDPAPGSVTEQTLDTLRNLDPERAASAHDRGEHGEHDRSDLAEAMRLSGVDPARIVIPAIDVDAEVIDLGVEPSGDMETPSDYDQAGWFRNGPKPGRVGPSLIAGHVDDRSGPAVFFRLSQLQPGDEIEVHGEDGEVVVFAVTGQEQFPKDELPQDLVFGGTSGAELRLVTCGGDFDRDARSYTDNTIVFAERVDHLDA